MELFADSPSWALEEIELLRGRALGASRARLSHLLLIARGEQSHIRGERLSLTDRGLDRLFKTARRFELRRDGGIGRLYKEVQVLPGRCPFCRQYFELLDNEDEDFCDECIAAGVNEALYAELILSLQVLRRRRREEGG